MHSLPEARLHTQAVSTHRLVPPADMPDNNEGKNRHHMHTCAVHFAQVFNLIHTANQEVGILTPILQI
jgi:hypothetical protein